MSSVGKADLLFYLLSTDPAQQTCDNLIDISKRSPDVLDFENMLATNRPPFLIKNNCITDYPTLFEIYADDPGMRQYINRQICAQDYVKKYALGKLSESM